ncbi:hypothetical protein UY3_09911 [Chelonia mydas]|uniref:Uncharacterized protein n=1 Tax=Chelonia mydas TaxID=8469 RepID=M7BXY3_CHEMY|nr:hypothetical protein UY3_09911 [Chelonia mydas]
MHDHKEMPALVQKMIGQLQNDAKLNTIKSANYVPATVMNPQFKVLELPHDLTEDRHYPDSEGTLGAHVEQQTVKSFAKMKHSIGTTASVASTSTPVNVFQLQMKQQQLSGAKGWILASAPDTQQKPAYQVPFSKGNPIGEQRISITPRSTRAIADNALYPIVRFYFLL